MPKKNRLTLRRSFFLFHAQNLLTAGKNNIELLLLASTKTKTLLTRKWQESTGSPSSVYVTRSILLLLTVSSTASATAERK